MNMTLIDQETIRKKWLYSYFGGITIFVITSIIQILRSPEGFFNYTRTVTIGDQAPQVSYPPLPLTWLIFKIFFLPCFYIGIWYLVYRTVCERRGTKVLLFTIIANGYFLVTNAQQGMAFIRQCISLFSAMDGYAMMLNALWIFYYTSTVLVGMWLVSNSSRLYAMNEMLQQEDA